MTDETKQDIQAEYIYLAVDDPKGTYTIGYIENGHMLRMNVWQKPTPEEQEEEILRCWPHENFQPVHAAGAPAHPHHVLIGQRKAVVNFKRPEPPKAVDLGTGPTTLMDI